MVLYFIFPGSYRRDFVLSNSPTVQLQLNGQVSGRKVNNVLVYHHSKVRYFFLFDRKKHNVCTSNDSFDVVVLYASRLIKTVQASRFLFDSCRKNILLPLFETSHNPSDS